MNWKTIWRSFKNRDMQKKILAVLGMLLVFRILAHIPIPLSNPETLRQILQNLFTSQNTPQLLSFLNVLSGGALANFSIMLIGLGPYINASIIIQLLTRAIPKLENLNKEGEFGRRKLNQYTRMLTFPLAIIQSIGSIYLVKQAAARIGGIGDITANTTLIQWVLMIAALTGGSMLLMWLGELITEQGIGNGISLIITVGIVSRLPATFGELVSSVYDKSKSWVVLGHKLPFNSTAFYYGVGILVSVVLTTWLVVKLSEAARNITVNYAKRVQGNRAYGQVTTILPVKLITAGVIPIIFAIAFLSVPGFAGQLLASSPRWSALGAKLTTLFQTPSPTTFAAPGFDKWIYPLTYFALVVVFTYFYTSITFNSKEIAENLQKQGGFIGDVRAGKGTEKYLSRVVNRLTLFGSISLGFLALLPILAQAFLKTSIAVGGTSILILVAVGLETLRSLESRALMLTYDQYSSPEYFAGPGNDLEAATGAKRVLFGGLRNRRKTKK